jgi:23S rRNA U2552 (ribose-2'-O)-methylase RlmE/FtsJ
LDLRGGMYVTLEVDVLKLIRESASDEAVDDVFADVINATKEEIKTSEEAIIDVFQRISMKLHVLKEKL